MLPQRCRVEQRVAWCVMLTTEVLFIDEHSGWIPPAAKFWTLITTSAADAQGQHPEERECPALLHGARM